MISKALPVLVLLVSISANAHCPVSFKAENACFMLSENVIYVYDHKAEHNGPYKDFKDSTLSNVKYEGNPIKFNRVARGVYRLDFNKSLKVIEIEITNAKKKAVLKLSAE